MTIRHPRSIKMRARSALPPRAKHFGRADTGPGVAARHDELDIPDWVPGTVAALAQDFHRQAVSRPPQIFDPYTDAARRLAICAVWRQLIRRVGGVQRGGLYVHPACADEVRVHPNFRAVQHLTSRPVERDRLQEQAIALLFLDVSQYFSYYASSGPGPMVITRSEIIKANDVLEQQAQRYESEANRLERSGDLWIPLQLPNGTSDGLFKASILIRAIAAAERRRKRQPDPRDPLMIDRDPLIVRRRSKRAGDDRLRTVVILTVDSCKRLFGSPLLGSAAALVNTAIGQKTVTKGIVQGVVARLR
jgi:hypothetical protein